MEDNSYPEAQTEAYISAMKSVQNTIKSSSDLDKLANIKQIAISKHAAILSNMKTKVQTSVDNVERGLNDLNEVSKRLFDLLNDIQGLKNQSSNVAGKITKIEQLTSLSTIWENVNILNTLNKSFQKAEQQLADIQEFFRENPTGISINCFNVISQVNAFKSDLLLRVTDDDAEYVANKFRPAQECLAKLNENANRIVSNMFKDQSYKNDQIIRATYLILQNSFDLLKKLINDSISLLFKDLYGSDTDDNINKKLGIIDEIVSNVSFRVISLIDCFPQEINFLEMVSDMINNEAARFLSSLMKNRTLPVVNMRDIILWLKNFNGSMKSCLGSNPSLELNKINKTLENSISDTILKETKRIFGNIVMTDVAERGGKLVSLVVNSIDGLFTTDAPYDMAKHSISAINTIKECGIQGVMSTFGSSIIRIFGETIDELNSNAQSSIRIDYLIASNNNAKNGISTVNDCRKKYPSIFTDDAVETLKEKWGCLSRESISRLRMIIIRKACGLLNDETPRIDFHSDYYDTIEKIWNELVYVQSHLVPNNFEKFNRSFFDHLGALFIDSVRYMQEVHKDQIVSECNHFILFLESKQIKTNKLVSAAIEKFSNLMTDSLDIIMLDIGQLYDIYPEIEPDLYYQYLQKRTDLKLDKEFYNKICNQYEVLRKAQNAERNDNINENFFDFVHTESYLSVSYTRVGDFVTIKFKSAPSKSLITINEKDIVFNGKFMMTSRQALRHFSSIIQISQEPDYYNRTMVVEYRRIDEIKALFAQYEDTKFQSAREQILSMIKKQGSQSKVAELLQQYSNEFKISQQRISDFINGKRPQNNEHIHRALAEYQKANRPPK